MRSARAFLASLGASTCLVLAGTVAMAMVSTLVAFTGLPGMQTDSAQAPTAVLIAAAGPRSGSAADAAQPAALALPALREPPARRAPARRVETASPVVQADPGAAPAGAGGPGAGTFEFEGGEKPSGVNPGDPPDGSGPARETVREAAGVLGGTVAGAGDGLAEVVAPISPPVADVVGGTSVVAGDVVTTVAEVVAGVLGG